MSKIGFLISWNQEQRDVLKRMIDFHENARGPDTLRELCRLQSDACKPAGDYVGVVARHAISGLEAGGFKRLMDPKQAIAIADRKPANVIAVTPGKDIIILTATHVPDTDVDVLIDLIQGAMKALDIAEPVQLEWGVGTSGAGAVVTRTEIHRISVAAWLEEKAGSLAAKTPLPAPSL